MILAGVVISLVFLGIGGTMMWEGDNVATRVMGATIIMMAGFIFGMSTQVPQMLGWIKPDHTVCQSYQWLDESWKCVPVEEAG